MRIPAENPMCNYPKSIVISVILIWAGSLVPLKSASAQSSVFQAGLIFGNPTGFSAKYWINTDKAIDFAVSLPSQTNEFSSSENTNYIVHSTYLTHQRNLLRLETGELIYYNGVGGTVTLQDNPIIGIRGVMGLDYVFPKIPVNVFIEFAPVFHIYPASIVDSGLAIGTRYHF